MNTVQINLDGSVGYHVKTKDGTVDHYHFIPEDFPGKSYDEVVEILLARKLLDAKTKQLIYSHYTINQIYLDNAIKTGCRWRDKEDAFIVDWFSTYACKVIKKRDEIYENKFLKLVKANPREKDMKSILLYANQVIHGRWIEAESILTECYKKGPIFQGNINKYVHQFFGGDHSRLCPPVVNPNLPSVIKVTPMSPPTVTFTHMEVPPIIVPATFQFMDDKIPQKNLPSSSIIGDGVPKSYVDAKPTQIPPMTRKQLDFLILFFFVFTFLYISSFLGLDPKVVQLIDGEQTLALQDVLAGILTTGALLLVDRFLVSPFFPKTE